MENACKTGGKIYLKNFTRKSIRMPIGRFAHK
jgi:hypothetical protein